MSKTPNPGWDLVQLIRDVDKIAANIPAPAAHVLMAIALHGGGDRGLFPSEHRLSQETGQSDRNVRRMVDKLVDLDIMVVQRGRQHVPNRYTIREDVLSALPRVQTGRVVLSEDSQTGQAVRTEELQTGPIVHSGDPQTGQPVSPDRTIASSQTGQPVTPDRTYCPPKITEKIKEKIKEKKEEAVSSFDGTERESAKAERGSPPVAAPMAPPMAHPTESMGGRPRGALTLQEGFWVEAYQQAARATGKVPEGWMFPATEFGWRENLHAIVQANCKGEDRKAIDVWLGKLVTDFVVAVSEDEKRRVSPGFGAKGLFEWINGGKPGLQKSRRPQDCPIEPLVRQRQAPLEEPPPFEQTVAGAEGVLAVLRKGAARAG